MAKLTIVFGSLLILLSVVAIILLGHHTHAIHSLIPALFGLLLIVFGKLAITDDPKKRMLFMHIAVTIGLLGFLGTLPGIIATVRRAAGQIVATPVVGAATVQTVMGTLCLIYVLLCVRSFITVRRSRTAASA
jgi:uncharacterized membrane protein HdeD (DUF308 family)